MRVTLPVSETEFELSRHLARSSSPFRPGGQEPLRFRVLKKPGPSIPVAGCCLSVTRLPGATRATGVAGRRAVSRARGPGVASQASGYSIRGQGEYGGRLWRLAAGLAPPEVDTRWTNAARVHDYQL